MGQPLFGLHAPDGFLQPGTAAVTAVLAIVLVGYALRQSGRELAERQIPLAGMAAAFVFAAQTVKFPVASGTTGHMLGAALVAILLGPSTGAVVATVVLVVQALVFADGGLSALGYNVLNMALVPAFGGYGLYVLIRRLLPDNRGGIIGACGLAAGLSVVLAAMAFSLEWLFGASAPVAFDDVFAAVVGVHALIGVGEGVLSGLALGAVLASRPDLVHGASDLDPAILGARETVSARTFLVGGVAISLVLAAVISQVAADGPDGLERTASDLGFADAGTEHALDSSLFADYATRGVDNKPVSLAVAGVAGTLITLAVGLGLARAARLARPVIDRQPAS